MQEQRYNACGRSDSEGGRPTRPAIVLVHAFEAQYTQHQLLTLLVVREMLSKSYRVFADIASIMTPLLRRLRLDRMPHFTTLHKFSM